MQAQGKVGIVHHAAEEADVPPDHGFHPRLGEKGIVVHPTHGDVFTGLPDMAGQVVACVGRR